MTEFCDWSILAGKFASLTINSEERDVELRKLFLDDLFRVDNIDNMSVRYITIYLHSDKNREVFTKTFDINVRHNILNRLISLWHSNMSVVEVKRDTKKIIAKLLIDVLVYNEYNVTRLLKRCIMEHPFYIAFKYVFLKPLLRVAISKEIGEDLLTTCYDQLKRCLEINQLATISSGPIVVLYEKFKELGVDYEKKFFDLLFQTITSVNCRAQACRLWLPHFAHTIHKFDVFNAMHERIWAKLFSNQKLGDLTTIATWTAVERYVFAWLSVVKLYPVKKRLLVVEYFSVIQVCLRARQASIKVLAISLINELEKADQLSSDVCIKERVDFIHENSMEEDGDVQNSVLETFKLLPRDNQLDVLYMLWDRPMPCWEKTIARLIFLTLLNANQTTCHNFLLGTKFAKTTVNPSERLRLQAFLFDAFCDPNERSIRDAAFKTLHQVTATIKAKKTTIFEKSDLTLQLSQRYEHHRCNINLTTINICQLLIDMEPHTFEITAYLGIVGTEGNQPINELIVYLMNADRRPISVALFAFAHRHRMISSDSLLSICNNVIQDELLYGGSTMVGYCLNMPQINTLFETLLNNITHVKAESKRNENSAGEEYKCPTAYYSAAGTYDDATAELSMTSEQLRLMKAYASLLIQGCAAVAQLAKCGDYMLDDISKQHLILIWSVLLRTYHKGVIQKCSVYFKSILAMFSSRNVEVGRKMLNLTIRVLKLRRRLKSSRVADFCKSRDLAFAEIFNSICECFPSLIDECVDSLIEAFRRPQTIVDIPERTDIRTQKPKSPSKKSDNENETDNDGDFEFFAAYTLPIQKLDWYSKVMKSFVKKSGTEAVAPPVDKAEVTTSPIGQQKQQLEKLRLFTIMDVRYAILTIFCRLLESSELDLSGHYSVICALLVDLPFKSGDFKLFSLSCRTAVLLTNTIFKGSIRMPLSIFLGKYYDVFWLLCSVIHDIAERTQNKIEGTVLRGLSILLTPFERIVVSSYPFNCHIKANKTVIRKLLNDLKILFGLNPSLIVRCQIINILANFIPQASHKNVCDKLFNAILKADVFTHNALNCFYGTVFEKETSYEPMMLQMRRAGKKFKLTDPEWMLNTAVRYSTSSLLSERILAAELFFNGYKQLAKDNPTTISVRLSSDMPYICQLLEDERRDVRNIICLCSVFIDLRSPFCSDKAPKPYQTIEAAQSEKSWQNIAQQIRLPLDTATIFKA